MTIKVAINGFGRIGRNILRAFRESKTKHDLQFVAINDLGDAKTNAHLLKYDTAHGRFKGTVEVSGNSMQVNGQTIQVVAERDPSKLPWKARRMFLPMRPKPLMATLIVMGLRSLPL